MHLVDFFDQRGEGAAGSFDQLGIWILWITVRPSDCISFNLIRGAASLRPFAILAVAVPAVVADQMFTPVRDLLQKKF